MRKLELIDIKKYNVCVFKDLEDDSQIELMFEFWGVATPTLRDKILIHEDLLNKKSLNFVQPYSYELSNEYKPKQVKEENMKEFIVLNRNGKNYVLKRIYG